MSGSEVGGVGGGGGGSGGAVVVWVVVGMVVDVFEVGTVVVGVEMVVDVFEVGTVVGAGIVVDVLDVGAVVDGDGGVDFGVVVDGVTVVVETVVVVDGGTEVVVVLVVGEEEGLAVLVLVRVFDCWLVLVVSVPEVAVGVVVEGDVVYEGAADVCDGNGVELGPVDGAVRAQPRIERKATGVDGDEVELYTLTPNRPGAVILIPLVSLLTIQPGLI